MDIKSGTRTLSDWRTQTIVYVERKSPVLRAVLKGENNCVQRTLWLCNMKTCELGCNNVTRLCYPHQWPKNKMLSGLSVRRNWKEFWLSREGTSSLTGKGWNCCQRCNSQESRRGLTVKNVLRPHNQSWTTFSNNGWCGTISSKFWLANGLDADPRNVRWWMLTSECSLATINLATLGWYSQGTFTGRHSDLTFLQVHFLTSYNDTAPVSKRALETYCSMCHFEERADSWVYYKNIVTSPVQNTCFKLERHFIWTVLTGDYIWSPKPMTLEKKKKPTRKQSRTHLHATLQYSTKNYQALQVSLKIHQSFAISNNLTLHCLDDLWHNEMSSNHMVQLVQ